MTKEGIDGIGGYIPKRYVDLRELAKKRGVSPEKFTIGLGQDSFAVPASNEDSLTMAANSLENLFENSKTPPEEIGRIVVATETPLDFSKPLGSYLHSIFNLAPDCETFEIKNACIGGTFSLIDSISWVKNNDRKAVVICTDIAKYEMDTPAEPTQGAGSVSLLISKNPRILEVEDIFGTATRHTHDFYRPLGEEIAKINGAESLRCYQEGFERTLENFIEKGGNLQDLEAVLFHIPYPGIIKRLSKKIPETLKRKLPENFKEKSEPSLIYSKKAGNLYTGSLYLSLASLLNHTNYLGKRIGFFSYGSGYSAKFFAGRVNGELPKLNLGPSEKISIEDYELLRNGKKEISETEGFVIEEIDQEKIRRYQRK